MKECRKFSVQHDKNYRCPAARGPCSSGARANGPWLRRHCQPRSNNVVIRPEGNRAEWAQWATGVRRSATGRPFQVVDDEYVIINRSTNLNTLKGGQRNTGQRNMHKCSY